MSKYVDLDKVIDKIDDEWGYEGIREDLYDIPTADVEEVKHGKWIKDKSEIRGDGEIYDYCCSLCKSPAAEGSYGNCDVLTPYCSQCGARMDGGENGTN